MDIKKLISLNYKVKNRKAVSQVIGSVFMLAIVASVGSLVLIQGLGGINTFEAFLDTVKQNQVIQSTHERIVVEHVRFVPSSKEVDIWIRNTGTDDVTIDTVAMVKISTQELVILNKTSDHQIFPDELAILVNGGTNSPSDVTLPSGCGTTRWDQSATCFNANYKISITTVQGSSFDLVVRPFNT